MAKVCLMGLGLAIVGLQIWIIFASGESSPSDPNPKKVDPKPQGLPFCGSSSRNRNDPSRSKSKFHVNRSLLLVSTLDGQVSALEAKSGHLLWSVVTTPGAMMSSSISKIEMSSKGEFFRVIPSLDGGLFRFDGTSMEALPVTADTLLSSSLKLADDVVIAGAKDNRIFGVDFTTGKLRYSCSMAGCEYYGSDTVNQDDILVVRRHTNVVRAVDPKNGLEKWNYSVGRHELSFIEGSPDLVCSTDKTDNDADVEVEPDDTTGQQEKLDMKVVSSRGVIAAKGQTDPDKTIWQYQFDSPVLDAWWLQGGNLEMIDLFDKVHTNSMPVEIGHGHDNSAMLYVGIHNKQLYIQQSHAMMEKVSRAAHDYAQLGSQHPYPRIQWKPYLVTAQSRTPYVTGTNLDDSLTLVSPDKVESTALMIRHETDYPYDGGYYLFPEETPLDVNIFPNQTILEDEETLEQIIIVSLWYWWREILGITIGTVILNLLITRYCMKKMRKTVENNNNQIIIMANTPQLPEDGTVVDRRSSNDKGQLVATDYVSRYLTDFEPVYCLGKGGFGVVFHARNKIDDCDYAIKRICLPNRDDAREKVMREVKALAKLDHVGIVRYYNAWLECPPSGWQEQVDKEWEQKGLITPSACLSSEDSTDAPKKKLSNVNPFNPFGNNFLDEEKALLRCNNNTSSFGFIPGKQDEESGSFSFERRSPNHNLKDPCQLLDIMSRPLESGDSEQVWDSVSVPYQRYHSKTIDVSGDSFIVFEDSGCGEKSDSIAKLGETQENDWSADVGLSSRDSKQQTANMEAAKNLCNQIDHSPAGTNIRPKSFGTSITSNYSVPGCGGTTPKIYLHIQMQLCKRENLKDWLNVNSKMRDKIQVLDFFDQIVSAVEYVHDQGLMHRDLKPSNIFFSIDGSIKVGDFGLVTTMAEGSDDRTPSSPGPYHKHTDQVGTQLYMSPEQITGQSYSHKVDIYSLGLIFFELLVPFTTQMERLRVMLDVKKQKFPPTFEKEKPEECSFVQQMLARAPEFRPSASDIKQHSLLQAFQPRPEILQHRRTRNMSRTYSTSSSGSGTFD